MMPETTKVRRIELDQACAGMVLAEALCDAHGGVLLAQGASLTDATLAALRRRGVEHCSIVCAPQVDPAARARERERQLARLQRLFRHSGSGEAGATLLKLLTDYRNRD